MDTIKLFFELVIEAFIGVDEVANGVKETERLIDNIEKTNDDVDLRGPLSRVTGKINHRSDEFESQNAINLEKTDFCNVKCL